MEFRRILRSKQFSDHPDDKDIQVVLVQRGTNDYVTWIHNQKENTYFWGHYITDLAMAIEDFNGRGKP